ncbi:MAG: transporter [Paracoccus sp. (in: a-proteobacteria)]|uniref:SphA family protein n=1 Tax=Paracoccus sp. TaxID=267 RepID=UPI0026E0C248|nr:transporter [Paracoccus sp. (in: a-proteobacteria)]MDO5620954.1 transporter [Paracoccus sp. (in: a-proteobacteria)]
MKKQLYAGCAVAALGIALPMAADAAENGMIQYAPGSAQFYAGAIPPVPGLYILSQTSIANSDEMTGSDGNALPFRFSADVKVETIRLLGVTDHHIGGGRLFWQAVFPIMLDLDLQAGPYSGSNKGLADTTVSAGLAWHQGPHTYVTGLDIGLPTGSYRAGRIANPGLNYWSVQPTVGYHYLDFRNPKWEVGVMGRYIHNGKNDDTDYTTGDQIVFDFAVGRHFGPWRIGAAGYYQQQVSDDKGAGAAADGHRSMGIGLGPSITYTFPGHKQLGISYMKDIKAENRNKGETVQISFSTKF